MDDLPAAWAAIVEHGDGRDLFVLGGVVDLCRRLAPAAPRRAPYDVEGDDGGPKPQEQ